MSEKKKRRTSHEISPPGYTIELQLSGQQVLILGGGSVAKRKLPDLLHAGAIVSLVAPEPLGDLPNHPNLTHHQRCYQSSDLTGMRLIFAATNNPQVNDQIAADAKKLGIFCSRADNAEASDFISPARLLRPPLSFSISTGGNSPAMAAALRDQLADMIPTTWQTATELVAAIRRKVLTEQPQVTYNQQVLLQLIDQQLLEFIANCDTASIDQLLFKHFGAEFSLKTLQFQLPEGTP